MVGGTTSGYSLMGNRHIAINPMMKIKAESTPAKIGRRMKKCEKFMRFGVEGWRLKRLRSLSARGLKIPFAGGDCGFRGYGHPGPDALEAVDHHLLARL